MRHLGIVSAFFLLVARVLLRLLGRVFAAFGVGVWGQRDRQGSCQEPPARPGHACLQRAPFQGKAGRVPAALLML